MLGIQVGFPSLLSPPFAISSFLFFISLKILMGDEQKCSKKKKKCTLLSKKKGWKKMHGREIVLDYFFPRSELKKSKRT